LPKSAIRQLWFERFTLKDHISVAEMLGDNRKRLILIDDHILVRQGLERLLNLGDKFVVCEETGDAASGLELVRELRPDGVIVDACLHYGTDGYLDIIHVKRGLNGSVRDLVSQMRNAMDTIENDLNVTGQPVLASYYDSIKAQGDANGLTKGQFVALFKKKRRYIFGYIYDKELSEELVDELTSSIAKNEIVSLVQYAKQLREKTSLHLVWIPKA